MLLPVVVRRLLKRVFGAAVIILLFMILLREWGSVPQRIGLSVDYFRLVCPVIDEILDSLIGVIVTHST